MLFPKVKLLAQQEKNSFFHFPKIPQHPMVAPAGGRVVHRAWQEEGEGQYKIHKTKDWVEEVI